MIPKLARFRSWKVGKWPDLRSQPLPLHVLSDETHTGKLSRRLGTAALLVIAMPCHPLDIELATIDTPGLGKVFSQ